jgi:hypothetical protein
MGGWVLKVKIFYNFDWWVPKIQKKIVIISPHGDAILKKLKIRLNACIILLLLLYLIGVIFSVNLKF